MLAISLDSMLGICFDYKNLDKTELLFIKKLQKDFKQLRLSSLCLKHQHL